MAELVTFRHRCLECKAIICVPVAEILASMALAAQLSQSVAAHCPDCVRRLGLKEVHPRG
jgi:DNA-directed RNA polymerase subunit RPC12/RpoP